MPTKSKSTKNLAGIGLPASLPFDEPAMGLVKTTVVFSNVPMKAKHIDALCEHLTPVAELKSRSGGVTVIECATKARAEKLLGEFLDKKVKDSAGKPLFDDKVFDDMNIPLDEA